MNDRERRAAAASAAADGAAASIELRPRPGRVLLTLLPVIVLLIAGHLLTFTILRSNGMPEAGPLRSLFRVFNLGAERNLPTLFSVFQLVVAAALLATSAWLGRARGRPWVAWAMLAGIFVVLAVDELMLIHERFNQVGERFVEADGFLHFAWVVPYAAIVVVLLVAFVPFLLRLPPRTRWLFIASGGIFVGGAMGLEMLSGRMVGSAGFMSWPHLLAFTAEESAEMVGIALFVYALLDHLRQEGLRIRLDAAPVDAVRAEGPRDSS